MTKATAVPQEIERKFLVANDGWRQRADQGTRFRQAYLAETERVVVRVRIEEDSRGFLTVKSAEAGLTRQEYEYPVPVAHAEALIVLCQGSVLRKTRFRSRHADRTWEVDVYSGDNEGLVTAEIEMSSAEDAVELPLWIGAEVTGSARYYASRLASRPFSSWSETERGQSG